MKLLEAAKLLITLRATSYAVAPGRPRLYTRENCGWTLVDCDDDFYVVRIDDLERDDWTVVE